MKTPKEIADDRARLERELESLEDQEQEWEELERTHRLAELAHRESCRKTHNNFSDSCAFHQVKWSASLNKEKQIWLSKVVKFLELFPDAKDDQVLAAFRVVR